MASKPNLFIVPRDQHTEQPEPEEITDIPLKVTGDISADTVAALRCLAFLVDFCNCMEPSDLRQCADEIEARQ